MVRRRVFSPLVKSRGKIAMRWSEVRGEPPAGTKVKMAYVTRRQSEVETMTERVRPMITDESSRRRVADGRMVELR